jgi:hypothetical protein
MLGKRIKICILPAAFIATLAGCQKYDTSAVVCWEEPVRHLTQQIIYRDKFTPEMRVICAPISAHPVGRDIIYSGPSSSAPSGSYTPGTGGSSPTTKSADGIAIVSENRLTALSSDGDFADITPSNVVAGNQDAITDLSNLHSQLDSMFAGSGL